MTDAALIAWITIDECFGLGSLAIIRFLMSRSNSSEVLDRISFGSVSFEISIHLGLFIYSTQLFVELGTYSNSKVGTIFIPGKVMCIQTQVTQLMDAFPRSVSSFKIRHLDHSFPRMINKSVRDWCPAFLTASL